MCEAKELYKSGVSKILLKKKFDYKSYQDLYDDVFEIDKDFYKNVKFLSFKSGYSNKIKSSFTINNIDDLMKYKNYYHLKNGDIDCNYSNNISFSNKEIYDIFNGCYLCEICLSETKFNSYIKGYNHHCKKCRQSIGGKKAVEKSKVTNMKKYGVEHPMQNDEIKIKKVLNMDYSNLNDKIQATCIKRYGDIFQRTDIFNQKRESTCLERYNVSNPFQYSEVKDKIKETRLFNFGVDHHMKSDTYIKTIYNTSMLNKYGHKWTFNVPSIINKIRLTNETNLFWVKLEDKTDYEYYNMLVRRETEEQYILLEDTNKSLRKSRIFDDAFELDHKFSIFNGFMNNIPYHIIASKHNLALIHWEENAKKGKNNSIDIEELYNLYFKY